MRYARESLPVDRSTLQLSLRGELFTPRLTVKLEDYDFILSNRIQVAPSVRPTIAIQRPLGRPGGMSMYSGMGPVKVVSGGDGQNRQIRYAVVKSSNAQPQQQHHDYQV